jgi:PhzF family phenazine biosynthesis protein
MPLPYLHYDVFTNDPLAGNQLAVFPEVEGLNTARMQRIAREMNFAETTFIFPADEPGTDVRHAPSSPRSSRCRWPVTRRSAARSRSRTPV